MIVVKDKTSNPVVPTEPEVSTEINPTQDASTDSTDSNGMKQVESPDKESIKLDFSELKYDEVITYLYSKGYTKSKFLGTAGYLILPQDDPDVRLVCTSLSDGFKVSFKGGIITKSLLKATGIADECNRILADATSSKTKDRHVNESSSNDKYSLEISDPENSIYDLLDYIKSLSKSGHSFSIVVDPGDDREKKFFIDGDGSDKIYDIKKLNEDSSYDDCQYENIYITYHDAIELKKLAESNTADNDYLVSKAQMIKDAVIRFLSSDYPSNDGDRAHAQQILIITDKILGGTNHA